MSLLIEQGKHKEEERNFEVIESKGETLKITKVELSSRFENSLDLTFKVISDNGHKNRIIWDNVTFDPDSKFAWKYLALRRAAGVPYDKAEPAKIDIEKLLVDKAVVADLSKRVGSDGGTYQQVSYKNAPKTNTNTGMKPENIAAVEEAFAEITADDDEDLDWS